MAVDHDDLVVSDGVFAVDERRNPFVRQEIGIGKDEGGRMRDKRCAFSCLFAVA